MDEIKQGVNTNVSYAAPSATGAISMSVTHGNYGVIVMASNGKTWLRTKDGKIEIFDPVLCQEEIDKPTSIMSKAIAMLCLELLETAASRVEQAQEQGQTNVGNIIRNLKVGGLNDEHR